MKKIEVVAAVLEVGDKILATERGYGEFIGMWEFPGGKIEEGETKEAALAREINEELRLNIKVGDFITTVEYTYPNFHLTMHCYHCSIIDGALTLTEHNSYKWLKKEELKTVNWLPADLPIVETLLG